MIRADFFDSGMIQGEQLPRFFTVSFNEYVDGTKPKVRVTLNDGRQVGDVISDNSLKNDFYRYHDVFHYSFATLLGWSPCTRAMIKCKRKSDDLIDEIEDGARATITEEAVSMIIFNEAKRKDYFAKSKRVSKTTLRIIKEMTENFEVSIRTEDEWQEAILKSYEAFRFLIRNGGGVIEFDAVNKTVVTRN